MNQNRRITLILALLLAGLVLVSAATAATTQVEIRKYANDNTTILNQTTVNYTWMMNNLPVLGDGTTHYYHQGPVFVDDPNPETQAALRWNPEEDTNVLEKDMGAVKGTNLKDLCDLVGGMSPGEEVKMIASDGWPKFFAYKNVYEYSSREGPIGICWYKNGQYPDTGYSEGMRMVWFADDSVNTLGPGGTGLHVFGNWDWHEAADEQYWYYYVQGGQNYPTTTGLSGQYINRIYIYSNEEPPVAPVADFSADVTTGAAPLTVTFTDQSTNTPTSWAWDFDNDGIVDSTLQNPSHTYNTPGTYTVNLTVTNAGGSDSEVKTDYITVTETPLLDLIFEDTVTLADGTFTWTDDGGVGHVVSTLTPHGALEAAFLADGFTYGGSWHDTRNTALINWIDTGAVNYSYDGSVSPKLTWNYQKNGIFQNYFSTTTGVSNNVVVDGDFLEFYFGPDQQTTDNATAVLRITVEVEGTPVPPTAAFTADVTTGPAPLTVQFTDQSSGNPTSWTWDFECDGTVDSTLQNPSHTYPAPGTYTVCLTVTSGDGSDDEVKVGYITVTDAPPASEFLTGWSYRKLITIGGSPDGDLTDYQVRFVVHRTAGTDAGENVYLGTKTNADYSDLRFTTTGNVLLPYWIESSDTGSAVVWVKVPSIPMTGAEMYLYYGNTEATGVSDGDATFLFFDDFTGSAGAPDSTKWDVVKRGSSSAVAARTGTGELHLAGLANSVSSANVISKIPFTRGVSIEYLNKIDNANYALSGFGSGTTQDETGGSTNWHLTSLPNGYGTASVATSDRIYEYPPGAARIQHATASGGSLYTALNTFYRHTIRWDSSNNIKSFRDGTEVLSATDSTYATGNKYIHFSQGEYSDGRGGNRYIDWVFVRKYTITPPAISAWGAEEGGAVPPNAAFTADPLTGPAPLTVQFTDQSSGTPPLTYAWDFTNDGTVDSTAQNPSHTYSTPGTYTVRLNVTDAEGSDEEVKAGYITVTGTPPPAIPELFNGTVNLTPGASFTKVAYNSGTSYTINWTTPLGALQATGLIYNVTDKRWSYDQVLLLDDVEEFIRNTPGNWFAYVNDVYKDGYGNHANGLNVIELADGDRVDFYYAAGVVDKNNLTETLSKATAAVKTIADLSGSPPPGGDWTLALSGARDQTVTKTYFEQGLACPSSGHQVSWTDTDGNEWSGIPLWVLVAMIDDNPDTGPDHYNFNDALAAEGYSVKVTAGDGYSINFASADIARNNGYIVANTLNGDPLPELKPNSTKLCFPLQMIGPEVSSGQLAGNIASIELVGLPEPPAGWTLRMEGDVVDVISQQYFEDALACIHETTWTDGSGNEWSGVPLWILAGAVDDIESSSHWTFNDTRAATGYTIRVIAGDGYNRTFASADVARSDNYLVANKLNGSPLSDSNAPLRLVGANVTGGNRVGNIETIRLEGLPGYPAGAWSLELVGAISDTIPQPEFEDWAACHPATYTDGTGNVYEGIPLWRLMGWVDDRVPHGPNGFNNALAQAGYTVIVTAGDGYSKELTSQQIGTNSSFIVANTMNGSPLDGSKAPLQLVGSGLPSGSYSVGNIARIELTDFQEPTEIPTITIIKYAADGTTIINQTTVDHVWMEANLPVIGDGVTVYKYQGVTFDPADLWDPTETKGMTPPKIANAIKGTRVSDLCNLVGGMAPGTEVTFVATDGFTTTLPYDAIYPDPHVYSQLGDTVIAWYADGNYVPQYGDGPRLFFTPEDTVAGQWNMNQALPEQYWHYYYDSGSATNYPSVAGLSAKYVSTIRIYSAPLGDWVLALDGRDIGGLYQDISRSYFESALTCQFGAEHQAEYTDSSGRTWSGMPLWFLAGFVDDDDLHSNDAFNETLAAAGYDIIVTASDGFSRTIPSELIIRNNNYIVANALNGTRFAEDDGNWPLRLVGQNVTGGLSIRELASIDLVPREVSGDPELRIVPLQANLTVGATGTYQVMLTSVPEGLAGFNLSVILAEPTVGEIVSMELPGWATLNRSSPLPADTVWIEAVDLGKSVQAGATNVLLCEVTVRGDQPGISAIQVQPIQIDADGGGIIAPDPVAAVIAVYLPVSADFEANITSGNPPLTVAFTDLSTGSPLPSSWSWNFGEGQGGSTSQNPTHTYATWGTYTVALTVTNPYSADTETKTTYITVMTYVEPFPGYTNPPTDPDGDGLFEDINGNGGLDFDDVVAFYQNMAWVAGNTAVGIDPYDFNGNGRIDYDDVVLLYYEVLAG
ncbi:cell surface protein [hydrocarbon metagenome]|uniref:Cell surface protein n=1 Tax=hydrocarbon metagenome TaxID=938273 RepID=A0A0W8EMP6_9ZZZZ